MPRIADLEIDSPTDEQDVSEEERNEQGQTAHEVISDRFADILQLDDEETYDTEEQEEDEEFQQEGAADGTQTEEEDEAVTAEADEEQESDEDQEPQSTKNYDAIADKLVGVVGEEDLQNPEAIESAIDELVKVKGNYDRDKDAFEAVTNLFDQSDDMVQLAKYVKDGYTVNEAIAAVIDFEQWQDELKENDPEEYKKVVKRQMEREQRAEQQRKEQEAREQKINENKKVSNENWRKFKEAKGLEDEGAKEFSQRVSDHFEQIADGRITDDFLEVMYKGLNYEKDLETAKKEAEKDGKNAKINTEMKKTKKNSGDGLPGFKGGGAKRTPKKEDDDIFSVALRPRKRLADI